jgi:hypothetical protein
LSPLGEIVADGLALRAVKPGGRRSLTESSVIGGPKLNTVIVYCSAVPAAPWFGVTYFVMYTGGIGVGV